MKIQACAKAIFALGLIAAALLAMAQSGGQKGDTQVNEGVLSFTMKTIDGRDKPLADYKGKVLLIVNTASKCGFTGQYEGLEALYEKYKDRGLVVLGFPANNFLGQEPGTDGEIQAFCSTKFHVTFPLFAKTSVKGKDINPLYEYLTTKSGFEGNISWNFNKFLVDRSGKVVARYPSKVDPMDEQLVGDVERCLAEKG